MEKASTQTKKILIATRNVHKIRELRSMLKTLDKFDILTLLDFPSYTPPPENGSSFEENAEIKAQDAAQTLGLLSLADDSGLIVPAINGKPGIFSARFAGEKASDADNRKKLLHEMENLIDADRNAYFTCSLSLASPEGLKKTVTGTCEGRIIEKEKGGGGFGYDPLFVKYDYNKTFSELEETVKNEISHRRKAFDKLLLTLETL